MLYFTFIVITSTLNNGDKRSVPFMSFIYIPPLSLTFPIDAVVSPHFSAVNRLALSERLTQVCGGQAHDAPKCRYSVSVVKMHIYW